MSQPRAVGYIRSQSIILTRACRNHCGYCAFRQPDSELTALTQIARTCAEAKQLGATEVVFYAGERPADLPATHVGLAREGFAGFADYLARACELALQHQLLPTVAAGLLDLHELQKIAAVAAQVRIDVAAEEGPHQAPHGAHVNAPARRHDPAHAMIRAARDAGIPVSLGILLGVGESGDERSRFVEQVATWFLADGQLQEVRIIPVQPVQGCAQPDRPPLRADDLSATVRQLARLFPGVPRALPPELWHAWPDLAKTEAINDLGSLPVRQCESTTPGFVPPHPAAAAFRAQPHGIRLADRLPGATTSWNLSRERIGPVLLTARTQREHLIGEALRLVDNQQCFVCGHDNPVGLRLEFNAVGDDRCETVCTLPPAYQGYADIAHGGMLATLVDEVMAKVILNKGHRPVTAEMTVRFLHPAPLNQPLRVTGKLEKSRRRLHQTSAAITNSEGTVLCTATAKYVEPEDDER